jgi:gamma-glutamylputrescine oxidase
MTAKDNYYQVTRTPNQPARPALCDVVEADMCVVGAGLAGCSTALHLAQRGYRVVVLEADQVGAGASGRSGGQLLPGYSCSQSVLQKQLGDAAARELWQWSTEAVALCVLLIRHHHIECDLQFGHLLAAITPRQQAELRAWHHEHTAYGNADLQWLDANALRARINSQRYRAALHDPHAAHVHPLNFTLGVARAAEQAGATIYERSRVVNYTNQNGITIHSQQGQVKAKQLVLCGNVGNSTLSTRLKQRIMPVSTYIIATERLGQRAQELLPHNDAVADMKFIVDYYRRSADDRLLFGGRACYSSRDFFNTQVATRKRMLNVFPQLHDVAIDCCWGGQIDITLNRAPDFGRLSPNTYYLQGFSGHGMALAVLAGQMIADVLTGQQTRFDVYARLKHLSFPGGAALRTPALMLAMLWYRLRDVL